MNAITSATATVNGFCPGATQKVQRAERPESQRQTLRAQFRELVKQITRVAPKPKTKRGDETRGGFKLAAVHILRRVTVRLPQAAYEAVAFLSHTLDWMNPWHDDPASDINHDFEQQHTVHNHLSPHL